ncbi:MAG: VCBS repeat-containing protein [Planctomycetes bacterium]|nr:VCBS repeat-containing protein [Planctomycetota bacterium]
MRYVPLSTSPIIGALLCAISLAPECAARTLSTGTPAPERRIGARLEFPTVGAGKPTGMLAADLDGDKKSELIVVTSAPGTLQIWSGLSRALLGWPDPRAIAIEDFALGPVWYGGRTPDSKTAPADIVYSSRAVPTITVLDVRAAAQTADDTQVVKTFEVKLPQRARVLASGDLNSDGKFEIAVITVDDELVMVRGPDDVSLTKLAEAQATCAAFSRDGKSLFIGYQGSRKLVRYTFDANGKAAVAGECVLPGLPRSILELPPRQQGIGGLLVAGGDDAVWVCGGENGPRVLATHESGTIPFALLTGSLLGSEKFVTIALQGQEAVVRETTMSETTPPNVLRVYAGQHPRAGTLGDFDGDGLVDLAIANGDAQRIGVLFATEDERFDVARSSSSGRSTHSLACGDLDGDGRPEVVSLSALESTLSVSMNEGGILRDHRVQGRAEGGDAVRLADIDGDGHLDAVFLKRVGEKRTLLDASFGDGKGHLFQRAEFAPMAVGASPGDLLIADLIGDGRLSALVADPEGGKVALIPIERVANQDCVFGAPRAIDVPSGPKRLALIDVEGDKTPEIAVALAGPGPRLGVALLRVKQAADGALTLEFAQIIARETPVTALAVADFDQNGFADLVLLASRSDAQNHLEVHYQSTERTWSKSAQDLPTGLRPFALRAGDLDGDQIPDIVCSAQNSHHVNVWLNGGGTPIYYARIADFGVGTGPLDVQLADLNGNGQVEIIVSNAFSNDISVVRVK